MRRLQGRLLVAAVGIAAVVGALAPGCGGGGGGGGGGGPALTGVIYQYTDEPARDVPVRVLNGPAGSSRIDGLFALGPVDAAGVLRVGDSITTPTLLVPFTASGGLTALDRPVYLPSLESGILASLPATIAAITTIQGGALPGVTLTLEAGTAVNFPAGTTGEVRVVGVSPSRLPTPLPDDLAPRVAYLVEPHGVTFSPPATLRLPRLDPVTAGPFDAYEVSPTTGEWVLLASNVTPVNDEFALEVERGTLVCVVPSTAPALVDLTGRLVAGTQPVAGFRASCWNVASAPTDADGRFVIEDVPASYGVFYVRAYPDQPGVSFAPAVTLFSGASTTIGDITVTARAPDALRPFVRQTSPVDGQAGIGPEVQVVVIFSEPIDRSIPEPFELLGRTGKVAGRLNYDNNFTVRLIPTQQLETSQRYTILVDDRVQDLAGNALDDDKLAFDFTTRAGAPALPPTDTVAFGIDPLSAVRGDTITILGRNFTGGSTVTFGSTAALVIGDTSTDVRAVVPDFQPAGDVTLTLSAGGASVSALRPLVLDLRAQVLALFEGATPDTPLVVIDRAAPPSQFVVDGSNIGATQVTVDGLSIAAVDSTQVVGASTVATGRAVSVSTPAQAGLLTGPVVVRSPNGRAGLTYRFLQVRE
jgi:hypothetical protein